MFYKTSNQLSKDAAIKMSHKVDTDSHIPRYYQIYTSLIERIKKGEFDRDKTIPNDRLLATEYGVSRFTVVKALEQLKSDNIISREHGRGTFIKTDGVINNTFGQSLPLDDQFIKQSLNPHWKIVTKDWLTSPERVRKAFKLSKKAKQFAVTILLSIDKETIGVYQVYIPYGIAMKYQLETVTNKKLLVILKSGALTEAGSIKKSISAMVASKECQNLLNIDSSIPVLSFDLLYLDGQSQVQMYVKTIFRSDKFTLQL